MILIEAGISPASSWSVTSILWVLYIAFTAPPDLKEAASLLRDDDSGQLSRGLALFILIGLLASVALQLANAFVLQVSWPHLVALFWSLFVSVLLFVRIITAPWYQDPPAP